MWIVEYVFKIIFVYDGIYYKLSYLLIIEYCGNSFIECVYFYLKNVY